jgi:hypothetical protein
MAEVIVSQKIVDGNAASKQAQSLCVTACNRNRSGLQSAHFGPGLFATENRLGPELFENGPAISVAGLQSKSAGPN